MKTYLITCLLTITALSLEAQQLKNVDFVSPFHEGLAAVQKGDSWGFMDSNGNLAIDFRSDFAIQKGAAADSKTYPKFIKDRAMIQEVKGGITYYGFINSEGQIVIKPEFINVTAFDKNGRAIALQMNKEILGQNKILNKNIVKYSYYENIIDTQGKTVSYLRGPFHIIPDEGRMKVPAIVSYFISEKLVVVPTENNQWDIRKIE